MTDLVPLLDYLSVQEAHQIRNLLDAEGVSSFIHGEQSTSIFPDMGAVARVRLLVAAAQLPQAKQILMDARAEADSAKDPAWFCGECHEVVEAGFSVCWSCGGLQEDVEDPTVDVSQLGDREQAVVIDETEPISDIELDAANPYAAGGLSAHAAEAAVDLDELLNTRLDRAWRTAVMGTVIPFVMNGYSMYLLVTLPYRESWPAAARRRWWGTVLVDLLALLFWASYFVLFVLA